MKFYAYCLITAFMGPALAWGQIGDAPRGRTEAEVGVQVLTRGPVHEAFAETVTFDPAPGILVPKAPPAAIEELPPDRKPEGANVAWIPGYWGWDDERSDFLWVSGVWRALPPGRQWVPGYWGRSGQGSQWTSGYWADAKASEVEYLPEPPATVEAGPNIAASSADQTWLPGCWVWQHGRYAWRPGYWATVEPDWDWVPASLRLGPTWLRLRRRLLGLLDRPARCAVCAGLSGCKRVHTTRFFLLADDGDRPGRVRQPSLPAAAVPTLLLRRLLRRQLPRRGVPSVVFDQHRAFRLRSILRSPALAASAGQRMGASSTGGLRKPTRSREPATAAHPGEPGGNRPGRRGFSRARHRGPVARSSVPEPDRCVAIPVNRPGRATEAQSTRARGLSIPRPAATVGNPSGGDFRRRPRPPRRTSPHETAFLSDCGQVGRSGW